MFNLVLKRIARFTQLIEKPSTEQQFIRLSKWLSVKSICSRKQAQEILKLGLVKINGKRIYQNMLIPYNSDMKVYTPRGIAQEKPITKLWMINKPRGYICTHSDPQHRETIYSLLPQYFTQYGKIISIGRLDYNSEGLLLLTNDVTLKNLLQNPETKLFRYYHVKVHGRITPQKLIQLNQTYTINNQQYGPLKVTLNRQLSTNSWLKVSMLTGKNRQIRRIMQKNNLQVAKLKRLEYGPYKLGSLQLRQIMQLPISENFARKIKRQKAKLIKGQNCLVQVDTRLQAVKYAYQQLKLQQKQNNIQKITKSQKAQLLS